MMVPSSVKANGRKRGSRSFSEPVTDCDWFKAPGTVMLSALLAACVPSDKVPVTGHVGVEYERTTDSAVYVKLTNGSAAAISLQGSFDIWNRGIEITPGTSAILCMGDATSEEDGPGFADPPQFVSVPSGERVRVIVPSTLPQRFKGRHCQLHLFMSTSFDDGEIEFVP